jgi:hypothetical protein
MRETSPTGKENTSSSLENVILKYGAILLPCSSFPLLQNQHLTCEMRISMFFLVDRIIPSTFCSCYDRDSLLGFGVCWLCVKPSVLLSLCLEGNSLGQNSQYVFQFLINIETIFLRESQELQILVLLQYGFHPSNSMSCQLNAAS